MPSNLRIELFGWLRGRTESETVSRFRTRKTAVLFGYLAYYGNRSHPRDILADMLWPDAREAAGRNSLSRALSSLRSELSRVGEVDAMLATDRNTVQLFGATDVSEFESRVRAEGDIDQRIASLREALALYKGDLLPGHYDNWILTERTRLRDLFLKASHELSALLRKAGDLRSAITVAHGAVRVDPLSEEASGDLMRSYVAAREPHVALRVYAELERQLAAEMGERPSVDLRMLAREIAANCNADEDATPGPRLVPEAGTTTCLLVDILRAAHNLPPQWTAAMVAARARLKALLRGMEGSLLSDEPARVVCAFANPMVALDCAVEVRDALSRLSWPDGKPLETQIAVDTVLSAGSRQQARQPSEHVLRLGDTMATGEIILSEASAALVRPHLEPGVSLRELPYRPLLREHLYSLAREVVREEPLVRLAEA